MARLDAIVKETNGSVGAHKLKSSLEGHVGKLNSSLQHLRSWLQEEKPCVGHPMAEH